MVELKEQMWSPSINVGAGFGFPGLLVVSWLLTPRRPLLAPLVGAFAAAVHWTLGFTLLYFTYWRTEGDAGYAGLAFLAFGWVWALPILALVRRFSREKR